MTMIRGRIGERAPPLGNTITSGDSLAYKHEGKWYCKETHKEMQVTTLAELLDEHEKEITLKRNKANE